MRKLCLSSVVWMFHHSAFLPLYQRPPNIFSTGWTTLMHFPSKLYHAKYMGLVGNQKFISFSFCVCVHFFFLLSFFFHPSFGCKYRMSFYKLLHQVYEYVDKNHHSWYVNSLRVEWEWTDTRKISFCQLWVLEVQFARRVMAREDTCNEIWSPVFVFLHENEQNVRSEQQQRNESV